MEAVHRPARLRIASPRLGAAAAGLCAGLALVSFAAAHPGLIDIYPQPPPAKAPDSATAIWGHKRAQAWWARMQIEAGRPLAPLDGPVGRKPVAGPQRVEKAPTEIADEAEPEVLAEAIAPDEVSRRAAAFGARPIRTSGPRALSAPGAMASIAPLSRAGGLPGDGSSEPADLPAPTLVDNGLAPPTGLADQIAAAVPEPATWAMLILGFGLVGGQLRRRASVAPAIS